MADTKLSDYLDSVPLATAPFGVADRVPVVQSGNVHAMLPSWGGLVVTPQMFGAVNDLSADAAPAITSAVEALGEAGGTLYIPEGFYKIASPVTIATPVRIIGAGSGPSAMGGGGTVLRIYEDTFDAITVACSGACVFEDLSIDTFGLASPPGNGFAALTLNGDGTIGQPYNEGSHIRNLRISRAFTSIRVRSAVNYAIDHCRLIDSISQGIYLSGEGFPGSTGDDATGQSTILACVIQGLNYTASDSCIRYDCGGDVRIIGNKLIGADNGVRLLLNRGPTGTVIIVGNSVEEIVTKGVTLDQAVVNVNFGHLIVDSNQFLNSVVGANQCWVAVGAGVSGTANRWVIGIVVKGNVFRSGAGCIDGTVDIQDGQNGIISGNTFWLGALTYPAWNIGTAAVNVVVGPNSYSDVGSPIVGTAPSGCRVEDTIIGANAASFSHDFGTVGAGSHVDYTFALQLAQVGNIVTLGLTAALPDGLTIQGFVPSPGNITLRVNNSAILGVASGTVAGSVSVRRIQ